MNRFLGTISTGIVLLGLAGPVTAQNGPAQDMFAYIDSQRILAEAPGAEAARQTFQQEMEGYQQELQPLEQELQQMMNDYQQQQSVLQPDARRQREEAIRAKQQEYQQRRTQLQQQADQRMQELLEPVMGRINQVIRNLRRERGYLMIFDASQGALIDADPQLDLTEEVLTRLTAGDEDPPTQP